MSVTTQTVNFTDKMAALSYYKNHLPITCIIDVGIQTCTSELVQIFPNIKHHLFEVNPAFTTSINKNYSKISHQLYIIGLSNKSSNLFAVSTALRSDGVITHTAITPTRPEYIDGKKIVKVEEIKVEKFSNLQIDYTADFFLKVDVDGTDLDVIEGLGDHINKASIVQIEATFVAMAKTLSVLHDKGFRLMTIVDQMFYGSAFYQCDLIFIRKDLITQDLAPAIHDNFDGNLWRKMN